jgi:hypothetical protein
MLAKNLICACRSRHSKTKMAGRTAPPYRCVPQPQFAAKQ